jgi:hypothetical protein
MTPSPRKGPLQLKDRKPRDHYPDPRSAEFARHLFVGITSGGSDEDGDLCAFTIKLADDTEETFYCQAGGMPAFMTALNYCLRTANDKKEAAGRGDEFVSSPMTVTGVTPRGSNADARKVAVQLTTEGGLPLDIAVTPETTLEVTQILLDTLNHMGIDALRRPVS